MILYLWEHGLKNKRTTIILMKIIVLFKKILGSMEFHKGDKKNSQGSKMGFHVLACFSCVVPGPPVCDSLGGGPWLQASPQPQDAVISGFFKLVLVISFLLSPIYLPALQLNSVVFTLNASKPVLLLKTTWTPTLNYCLMHRCWGVVCFQGSSTVQVQLTVMMAISAQSNMAATSCFWALGMVQVCTFIYPTTWGLNFGVTVIMAGKSTSGTFWV